MSQPATSTGPAIRANLLHSETWLSVGLLVVLGVLLVPLPPLLLDMLLAINIGLGVLLLLITLSAKHPLDLSVFPSLLLLLTLYRLSLNVATTRLILLDGDAGRIVSTFGGMVVGGNLIVGLVIFLILVAIQFIVITKGSGRISEVAARFTLDAMPGKQMAIDAEMNAGVIDEKEARERRDDLNRQAEFYGAMDGAGKFVRGDAIAGLIITAINLTGGIILGISSGLPVATAFRQFSILTIGDGLVSQVPAVIIATTAGILVTKTTSAVTLGDEIGQQLLRTRRPLMIGCGLLSVLAFVPGMPTIPFLLLAGGLAAWLKARKEPTEEPDEQEEQTADPNQLPTEEEQLQEFLLTDRACLRIGVKLIPLVSGSQNKGLQQRLVSLRRDLSRKHGIWIPPVRICDDIALSPEGYSIQIAGREVASGEIRMDKLLAIDPGETTLHIEGETAEDPAFGLPARWIDNDQRRRAALGGFTVVDPPSVLMTHLGEVLRRHAHELLSREDVRKMLDELERSAPTVVGELKPDTVRLATFHQVLVNLIEERVPVTNLAAIVESVVYHGSQIKDAAELSERVREDLSHSLCQRYIGADGKLHLIVIDPRLEVHLRESLREQNLALPPAQLEKLLLKLAEGWQQATRQNLTVAVLTDRSLRRVIRKTVKRSLPDLNVLSYSELPSELPLEPVTMISANDVIGAAEERVAASPTQPEPVGAAA